MAKKDFSNVAAGKGKVKSTIETATQENTDKRKTRKTYTAQETAEFLQERKTAGRKGAKLPRLNCAFSPDLYDYIKTMAHASGLSYTDFINLVLEQHRDSHQAQYKQAVAFRNSL